jgi:hypothetical protein
MSCLSHAGAMVGGKKSRLGHIVLSSRNPEALFNLSGNSVGRATSGLSGSKPVRSFGVPGLHRYFVSGGWDCFQVADYFL